MLLILVLFEEFSCNSYTIELKRQSPSPGTSCIMNLLSLASLFNATRALLTGSVDVEVLITTEGGEEGEMNKALSYC